MAEATMRPSKESSEDPRSKSSTVISFAAKPHRTSMAVWDLPSPIAVEGSFKVKIGVKCQAGCELGGARIEVRDSKGERVATGRLSSLPMPNTTALYWTEVGLRAPSVEGYHEWTAKFKEGELEVPHQEISYRFGLMTTVPAPNLVTVGVTDSVTKAPLGNAYVRIGGYTLFCDEAGFAKVSVPNGKYVFVVWKRNHKMSRSTIEITGDENFNVELLPSPCKYCPDST